MTRDSAGVSRSSAMVSMRDGVRLATDIYLPQGEGPFPTLLERTPYGRNAKARRERSVSRPQPMLRGEVAPEQVYSTIESDLQLAGKTSSGRKQTAANPPTIARAPDEAKRIRNALAAYGWDEVSVTDADREVMRATIDAVMQRHMAHAHMHVSDHGRSR